MVEHPAAGLTTRRFLLVIAGLTLLLVPSWIKRCDNIDFKSPKALSDVRNASVSATPLRSRPSSCLPLYTRTFEEIPIATDDHRRCILNYTASKYISAIFNTLVGDPTGGTYKDQPYNEEARKFGNDWPQTGYTMIGKTRLHNFRCAIEEMNDNQIPGAIVELGVWRGGAMMMASAVGKDSEQVRELFLFDAFDLIPGYGGNSDFLANTQEFVQENFKYHALDGPHVHFVRGLFKDSLPVFNHTGMAIAVLRVDGNFYDSYQDAFYFLYEKVPVGGIVIMDDVLSHEMVLQFWNDFKQEQGLPEELNGIDFHSAWFRKEKEIKLDWTKFRPPQDANL